jgi:trk system potassium uptake protein TrkA
MRVIIIGAGNVGLGIGRRLSAEGHDVVMLERRPARVAELQDAVDADVRVGDGASFLNLVEAGVRNADLLVAVGDNDETNIIASLVASKLGVKRTIARVRNIEFQVHPEVISTKEDLGVDLMINPEEATAKEIVRLLQHSGVTDLLELADGAVQLVGVILDQPQVELYDRPLSEIGSSEQRSGMRVVAIRRNDEVIVPSGADELHLGDHVYFIVRQEHVSQVLELCGKLDLATRHVTILGAGKVGRSVARNLSRLRHRIHIYDPDADKAERAAMDLPGVLVGVGDGTDVDLLTAEGLGENSAVVAVSDDEEQNVLMGLLAKRAGAGKAIVLVRRPHYVNLVTTIGIDAAVNPQQVTVSDVLRFLRGDTVLGLKALKGGEAEIMHLQAHRGRPGVGLPLKEIRFPRGCMIGAVLKAKRAVIPTGNTVIEDQDEVIAFYRPEVGPQLQELF